MRTLLRLAVFLVALSAVVLCGIWIASRGGAVTIDWGPWQISTTVARLALLLAGAMLSLLAATALIGLILRGPARLRTSLRQSRREKGYRMLTRGLVAVAAGDPAEARRHARQADRLLHHPPLTMLLSAQAALLEGDRDRARGLFKEMLRKPETEFLGLRGLMVEALRRGDEEAGRRYAERAHALRPDARWASDALFGLQGRAGDWVAAQRTLDAARDRRVIDRTGERRRRAVVLAERARLAFAAQDREEARRMAREAHAAAPELTAAAALLARLLIDERKTKPASRTIERSWQVAAHPELAELYRRTARETGVGLYRHMNRLVALADVPESHIAAARAALDAALVGEARRHLDVLATTGTSARAARLRAELEEAEGRAAEAQRWKEQAANAEGEAVWHCGVCRDVLNEWRAVCPSCLAFDAVGWGQPGREEQDAARRPLVAQTGAELIAGP